MEMWKEKVEEPYYGVTSDGKLREGLYKLEDQGAPVKEATAAAESLLAKLSQEQRQVISRELDSDVWRRWANRKYQRQGYRKYANLLKQLNSMPM